MKYELNKLDKSLKNFLASFLIVLSIGVGVGLIFVNQTTNFSAEGAVERFNGSGEYEDDNFEIKENYAKSVSEMLMTTHNHIIGFSFIFFMNGLIFYFNSIIKGFWKNFLLIEPFLSILLSFGSIWGMRFIHSGFVYVTVISAILMYASFFLMAGISLYELKIKRSL
ncbi:MAG: hypothetical protein KJ571_09615 [Bacteroidetes bacterium]|nr:hypothetical protein [Bacteroidota bacterium]